MTIRETPDGTILMHCFSGCSIHEIADAIGVDLTDLFPPKTDYHSSGPKAQRFYASDLLRVIGFEALVVRVAAANMAQGKSLSEEDRERLNKAQSRIAEALEQING